MKALKIFLITVTLLLIFALLLGVYVWYSLQKLSREAQDFREREAVREESALSSSESEGAKNNVNPPESEVRDAPESGVSDTPPEVVTQINTTDLTDSQQKALRTFGIEDDTFVITEAMIVCAKDAVGEVRYEEILGGAAPTPLESLKLFPCMNTASD